MRYRIFQNNQFLGTLSDRPEFDKAFFGEDPNNPKLGDKIKYKDSTFTIKEYIEHPSASFTENEFHEKDQEWFTDIIVE